MFHTGIKSPGCTRFADFCTSGQKAGKARWLLAAWTLVAGAALAQTPDVLVNHDGLVNGVQDTSGPAGGTFTYRVKVKHNAGEDAAGVTLTEVLPEGAIYVGRSSNPAGISCSPPSGQTVNSGTVLTAANNTFTCSVGDLRSTDGFKWVDFDVVLPTVSSTWKATASAGLPLPDGTNDGDGGLNNINLERNFTANDATDFGVKLASDAPAGGVNNGDAYNYNIQVNNYGPTALLGGGFARVTFQVPAGAPVTSAAAIGGTGWVCAPANGPVPANAIITCNYLNPPSGSYGAGAALPPITVPVTSQMGGPIGAAVSVEGFQNASTQMADGQKGNNTDSLIVQSVGADYTDVSLKKSVTPSLLDASGPNTVTYTLQARRESGALQPEQIVVTDSLPAGVTFSGFGALHANWNCSHAASVITCGWNGGATYMGGNNTNLPAITFTAAVPGQASGVTIANEGSIAVAAGTEPNTANNKGLAIVTFSNRAQLSLNKSAPQRPVKKGELFQYTITITNDGPMPIAANAPIAVTDTPDAALRLLSRNAASSAGWACSVPPAGTAGAPVTCENSSALAVGASIKLVLDAQVDAIAGEYAVFSNSATTGLVPGRDGATVSSTANVTVSDQSGDLEVKKTVQSAPPSPKSGDAITYRISVSNKVSSTQTARAIQITDVLNNLVHPNDGGTNHYPGGGYVSAIPVTPFPTGTSSVDCPDPTGNANSRTRRLTCAVDLLEPGATVLVDVTIRPRIVTASPLGTTPMTYKNLVSAFSPYINDPTPSDNTTDVDILMTSLVDLTVTKQVSPTTEVAVGQPAAYTVTTANLGPSSAQGVTMVDTLPSNAIMVGEPAVPSGGVCVHSDGAGPMTGRQGGVMTCTWTNALLTQSQYVVTYRARSVGGNPPVPPAPPATMDNGVVVSTTTEETDYTNNSANATIALKPAELDLQIQMSHSDDGLVLGGSTVYTITIKNDNASSSYATDVKMVDLFPAAGSTATFSYQGGLAVTGTNTSKSGYVGAVAGVVNPGMCTPPVPNPGATNGQLECVIPVMAPGDTVTIQFTMRAESLPVGAKTGTIFHAATVKPAETEYMPGYDALANNATSDRTSTSATAGAVDLGVKKQGPGGIPKAGDAVTYTITVTNYGQNPMSPAGTMTDTLPAGLNFVSASSVTAGATCSGTVDSSAPVNCVVPAMGKGASIVYTVETTVSSPFTGTYPLVNKADVTVAGDTNPDNDKDEVRNGHPPTPAPIPTLSEWGLILMSGLMGLMALWQMGALRRRQ